MGEYFELTFFACKDNKEGKNEKASMLACLNLSDWRNITKQHEYPLLSGREVVFDVFEETDFFEYRICLSDFILTKDNVKEKIRQLLEVVDVCFSRINSIRFATGIYELTYFFTEEITYIADINKNVFCKFPFLFFRRGEEFGMLPTEWYGDTACVLNDGDEVQHIYSPEEEEYACGDGRLLQNPGFLHVFMPP